MKKGLSLPFCSFAFHGKQMTLTHGSEGQNPIALQVLNWHLSSCKTGILGIYAACNSISWVSVDAQTSMLLLSIRSRLHSDCTCAWLCTPVQLHHCTTSLLLLMTSRY